MRVLDIKTNMSSVSKIYEGERQIGELRKDIWKSRYEGQLESSNATIEQTNIWRKERTIFSGNIELGQISSNSWQTKFFFHLKGINYEARYKNGWQQEFELYKNGTKLADIRKKWGNSQIFIYDDNIDNQLLLSVLAMDREVSSAAAMIPIFVVLFIVIL